MPGSNLGLLSATLIGEGRVFVVFQSPSKWMLGQ